MADRDVNTGTQPGAVLFRERETASGHRIGIATLNAEKSLNALTLDMIRLLDPQLRQWADDPAIVCVVLDGAGEKALCAGGDVRSLRAAILAHQGPAPVPGAATFFSEEYRLDHRIHQYPKPFVVWGGGIVMGGGLGLMAGASHRIVTETSRIAMPEVTIGLYPDVGGSWFLRRMPGETGLFLALTGASINAHDALAVGLADHFVKSSDRAALIDELLALEWHGESAANHATVSKAIANFSGRAAELLPESNVAKHREAIDALTRGASLAEVAAAIKAYAGEEAWLKKAAAALASGSPTSAALTWELRERARDRSLADVLRMELIVSVQCCSHPDFAEGVRALLIDKDNKPRWTPAALDEVTQAWIGEYFVSPWPTAAAHPLADL